jgi:hypothetical protein
MEMKKIQLERVKHQNEIRLVVRFDFDDTLKHLVKQYLPEFGFIWLVLSEL